MWLVLTGVVLLFAAAVTIVVALGWIPRATASPPVWHIPSQGGIWTNIVGTLAGFSVASAVFIAGFDVARGSPAFATVIGMLLLAFLILVFSALTYASTPNVPEGEGDGVMASLSHALANMNGCMGLSISWLAFVPLLEMIGLPALAGAFTWLLLFVALAAGEWTALFAYRLTRASGRACIAIPVLGFGLPAIYRHGVVRVVPALWPATDAALSFAFVAVAVAGLVLSVQAGLLLTYGDTSMQQRLWRHGHRIILGCSAATVLAVGLIWFAVAIP
jgi:hypothetical protein